MTAIQIIGGGVAGTAAALALHKAGFGVAVHEAHPDTGADIGAFLTLASNGMRALAEVDAAEAVAAVGFPVTTMSVLDATGAELATVPLGEPEHRLTRYRCLRRAELAATLRAEAVRRGITVRHGARLTAVTESATDITAHFADGTSVTGDLLVGADGTHSAVRAWLDPAAAGPEYAGQRVFYGYSTVAPPAPAPERITMVRGSATAFGYLRSPAGETCWFARVTGPAASTEEVAGTSPAQWREWLRPLLSPDDTPAARIVATTDDRLMVTNALQPAPGRRWRGRRAVLIGDAAHAASPATGQGASMALEDAVVLAKALRDAPGPAEALARYEHVRRPRTERNIATSARLTAGPTSAGPRPGSGRPGADQPPGPQASGAGRGSRVDEELLRLLAWDTPLP
ncbi:FAD-dependent monooxygenase [Kitasatospora sp. NPDC059327]|uniref:FAD-dependent monooxygenase n=1 Tax=Kitasatospora sp. NPDC059327 TaxID=3346803 RepID=UPI0036C474A5